MQLTFLSSCTRNRTGSSPLRLAAAAISSVRSNSSQRLCRVRASWTLLRTSSRRREAAGRFRYTSTSRPAPRESSRSWSSSSLSVADSTRALSWFSILMGKLRVTPSRVLGSSVEENAKSRGYNILRGIFDAWWYMYTWARRGGIWVGRRKK